MKSKLAFGVQLVALAWSAGASAAYPDRPLLMVCPFPPGGVVELVGRPLAASMEKLLKQPVVITNKPGAAGAVGNAYVATSEPDGYKLLMSLSSVTVIPEADKLFNRKPAYTLDQLLPIARTTADPTVLAVRSDAAWKSVADLVADAKKRAGAISYSSSGIYGALHVPTEQFALAAGGLKFRHVPFQGGGPAVTALLGGHVDLTVQSPSAVAAHVKSGRFRVLASWGAKRLEAYPNVPTLKESGIDAEYYIWTGVFVAAKTPAPVVATLRNAVRSAVQDGDFRGAMQKLETPIQYLDQPEFTQFYQADAKKLAQVVRQIGRIDEKK